MLFELLDRAAPVSRDRSACDSKPRSCAAICESRATPRTTSRVPRRSTAISMRSCNRAQARASRALPKCGGAGRRPRALSRRPAGAGAARQPRLSAAQVRRTQRVPVAAGSAVVLALAARTWASRCGRPDSAPAGRGSAQSSAACHRTQHLRAVADPAGRSQRQRPDQGSRPRDADRDRTTNRRRSSKAHRTQLLQLRVTVGDAYRNRGEMMAARRVFQRAVDEATPHIPKDDLRLLRARCRRLTST